MTYQNIILSFITAILAGLLTAQTGCGPTLTIITGIATGSYTLNLLNTDVHKEG